MTIWHQSGVAPSGEPFVQLMLDDQVIGQFTPDECRDFAQVFTQAAEAAETDAFLFDFATSTIGTTPQMAANLLIEFRRYREAHGKKGPPSDPNEFMQTDKHKKPEAYNKPEE